MCEQSIINDYESQIAALRFQVDALTQDRDSWKELSEAQLEQMKWVLIRLKEVNAQLDQHVNPVANITDL
jgi:hypothetical protein